MNHLLVALSDSEGHSSDCDPYSYIQRLTVIYAKKAIIFYDFINIMNILVVI